MLETIFDAASKSGAWNTGYWDEDGDEDGDETHDENEVSQEEYDEYIADRDEYLKQTRLLAQRNKEVNSLKKKLSYRVKKLDTFLAELKRLVEKYGDLENSADLLAQALLEFEDEEAP